MESSNATIIHAIVRLLAFIFKPKFTMGSILIAKDGNRVLMVRQHYSGDTWGFPGGFIEHHESPEACATRELFEETGLHVDVRAAHLIDTYIQGTHQHIDNLFGIETKGNPTPKHWHEIAQCKWVEIDELPKLHLRPETQLALSRSRLLTTTNYMTASAVRSERGSSQSRV
ncbi:NUDIX hydrolase [Pseudactinotalea sp. HY158]|uniref:NUDIX hydrolase n=1 Tax=Pseudactinotalea sp. HY158 TaxID=2654547 RepID=UPI00129C59D8|nr:NUDIX hydrolase [Pseudactinotalea sp. HY158]QGH69781.1 NUDIX domain-containing protein [Pseudactinotalea sp. HY158]